MSLASLVGHEGLEPSASGLRERTNQHQDSCFVNSLTRLSARRCEGRRVLGNHSPNPESDAARLGVVRGLASAVVQAVESADLLGAVAGARSLVTFVESLVHGEAGDVDTGNDNDVRAGLTRVVSPATAPGCLALRPAA